jgi:hypothetical protein
VRVIGMGDAVRIRHQSEYSQGLRRRRETIRNLAIPPSMMLRADEVID